MGSTISEYQASIDQCYVPQFLLTHTDNCDNSALRWLILFIMAGKESAKKYVSTIFEGVSLDRTESNWPILKISTDKVELMEEFTHLGVTVPKGFDTYNGNSIPWWLTSILGGSLRKRTVRASLIHDYLYSIKADKKMADKKYLEAMKCDNVPFAWVYYLGLVIFGRQK